jgi:hypothetical protein
MCGLAVCIYINRLERKGIGRGNSAGFLTGVAAAAAELNRLESLGARSSGIASDNSGATDHDPSVVQRP